MFTMTLVDHLRMTFGHVVHRHRAHSHMAQLFGRRSRWLLGGEAVLLTATAFTAIAAAFAQGRIYSIVSAVVACAALLVLLVHLTFDLEQSAKAHGACASRLWLIREQYRAFLSDLADGAIDLDQARHRRDALMVDLRDVYEGAPPAEQSAYQAAAQAVASVDEAAMAEEEIDTFLPKSMQKAEHAATSGPTSSRH
jgi:hypothetical protein